MLAVLSTAANAIDDFLYSPVRIFGKVAVRVINLHTFLFVLSNSNTYYILRVL
jgi:hypothetical protein